MPCKKRVRTVCFRPRTLAASGSSARRETRCPLPPYSATKQRNSGLALNTVFMYSIGRSSYVATFTQISPALSPASPARADLATAHLDLVLTMNAPVIHDALLRQASAQDEQPSKSGGYRHVIWNSCFGPIDIEVIGDSIFVNGDRVESAIRSESVHSH